MFTPHWHTHPYAARRPTPQSTTIISRPYSSTVIFLPISSRPPRGIIFNFGAILSLPILYLRMLIEKVYNKQPAPSRPIPILVTSLWNTVFRYPRLLYSGGDMWIYLRKCRSHASSPSFTHHLGCGCFIFLINVNYYNIKLEIIDSQKYKPQLSL